MFVNDAFSAAHRAHASTDAIARLLPAYAGPLLMEEVDALVQRAGEARAADGGRDRRRQGVEQDRRAHQSRGQGRQADHRRRPWPTPSSWPRASRSASRWRSPTIAKTALEIMHAAKARHCEIVLPHDVVVAAKLEAGATIAVGARARDAGRPDDPRRRPQDGRALRRRHRPLQDAAVERPARRLRDRALRRGHVRAGARGGSAHQGRQAHLGRRRRRHRGRAQRRRRDRRSSPTSRPPAAPSSNGWRGASCRASSRSTSEPHG